jgi:GAF domain-containing protein
MAKMTLKEYQEMVDERGQGLLDAIASLATGDMDLANFDIPEGVDILSDIALGLRILAEDFQELMREQEEIQHRLEERVNERTQELQQALADLQTVQSRYLHEQWDNYLADETIVDQSPEVDMNLSPILMRAIDVKKPVVDVVANGQAGMAVPVQYADELIGVLGFGRDDLAVWGAEDVTAVLDVVEQVGLALENQRLFDQTQTALSETASLYQGSTDINTAQNFDDILKALRQHTILGQKSSNVSINLFSTPWISGIQPEWSVVIARWSQLAEDRLMPRYRLAQFPNADKILSADSPTIIHDVASDVRLDEAVRTLYLDTFLAKSTLFIPLVAGNQWIGYINGIYPLKTQFRDDDIRRLTALSRQAAVAIQGIQLLDQTQQQLADLTTIQHTTSGLTQALTLEEAVDTLLERVVEAAQVDSASLYRLEHGLLSRMGVYPLPADGQLESILLLAEHSAMQEVVVTRHANVMTVDDVAVSEDVRQAWLDAGIKVTAIIPIVGQRGVFGVLSAHSLTVQTFTQQDLGLLQTLADQAIIAFERVQLLEETQRKAEREQLLREIAAKVRGSTDIETIMRTAVQEVGQKLGRKTFVYLGDGLPAQPQEEA